MSERICGNCGREATGWASIWTEATGDIPLCHGDDDPEPTCYEQAQWDSAPPLRTPDGRTLQFVLGRDDGDPA